MNDYVAQIRRRYAERAIAIITAARADAGDDLLCDLADDDTFDSALLAVSVAGIAAGVIDGWALTAGIPSDDLWSEWAVRFMADMGECEAEGR